jgi:hypothetical protein
MTLAEQLRENAQKALLKKAEDEKLHQQQRQAAHELWLEKVFPDAYKEVVDNCKVAAGFGRFEFVYLELSDHSLLAKIQDKLQKEEKLQAEIKFYEGNPSAFLYDLRRSYHYLVVSWKNEVTA